MTDTIETTATVSEAPAENGAVLFVPLNKLKKSPRNARKTPSSEAHIEALAASIAAKGMLQNLVVEPETNAEGEPTGSYFVTIGEGRRLAQLLRVKRKQIKNTEPIRCVLDTENDAAEISLDENVTREAMHPADQFERFRELAENREWGAEDIAARFGVSAHVVRQRLRLGAVSPKLMQVYRDGGLSLDQLMAFAITEDHDRQEQVYENLTIVMDGIDGRTHHVAGTDPARVEDARIGSVIEIGPAETVTRPSDRTIAAIAEDGIYRPSHHLEQAKLEGRVPGGDYEGYVDAPVRRLEALRRAGIVERINADQWYVPEDFVSRAATYDTDHNRQASVRVLSSFDQESQIGADGATWLDRRLVTPDTSDLAPAGFGQQVREAMDRRREHHIERNDATCGRGGRIFYRRNLLAALREREVGRVGAEMTAKKALPFHAAADGETFSGKFTGTVRLSSGKFAIVEKSHEFTLVPWRPVIDRQLGREVAGIVQGGSVSWQIGRQRGLGI